MTEATLTELEATLTDDPRRAEVPRELLDLYDEARRHIAENSDIHDNIMRQHFRNWAGGIVVGMLTNRDAGTTPNQWERESFRDHLANPELYPGGIDELRGDALHWAALESLQHPAHRAVAKATEALEDAKNVARIADRAPKIHCWLCTRRRSGLQVLRASGTGLDGRLLCPDCIETAKTQHNNWTRSGRPEPRAW